MTRRNVAILMQSRTASSLVAATFRVHGWVTGGDHVMPEPRNYVTHENQAVKSYLVKRYGQGLLVPRAGCDYQLRRIFYEEFGKQPWAWKGDVYYAEAFRSTFPNMAWIYVKRDIEDAVQSSMDMRNFPVWRQGVRWERRQVEDELRSFLICKYELMAGLRDRYGGVVVRTSDVLGGDNRTLREAIEYAGGEWNEILAEVADNR